MIHVADRVDVDQKPDAGDHHQHDGGEAVHREIDADVQRAALNPGVVVLDVLGFDGLSPSSVFTTQANDSATEPMAMRLITAFGMRRPKSPFAGTRAAEKLESAKGSLRVTHRCQYFIELTSSIISVLRFLNTVRIMANPTAASAAATTITKKL
jgi:hypothetical protein